MTQVLPPVEALELSAGSPESVTFDVLTPGEWQHLRATRIAALSDAPDAFVTTYFEELVRSPDEWIGLVERSPWVVARRGRAIVGIACLAAPDWEGPTKRFIESVWVPPLERRQGLVREMLLELELRAGAAGAEALQLWVLDTNESAADAYLKLGFDWVPSRVQNSQKSLPDGSPVLERLMIRPLFR